MATGPKEILDAVKENQERSLKTARERIEKALNDAKKGANPEGIKSFTISVGDLTLSYESKELIREEYTKIGWTSVEFPYEFDRGESDEWIVLK